MLKKLRGKEEGFTLIELMVVVLIIAILIAIAIPTFIGMRDRGYDSQAKSNLRNGITAAKTYYTDTEAYTGMNAAKLASIETAVDFVNDAVSTSCLASPAVGSALTTPLTDAEHAEVNVITAVNSGDNACMTTWTKGSDTFYYFTSTNTGEKIHVSN